MCCDVCAFVLGDTRQHTPAGGIRHFRDAGASHPDIFGPCKLLKPASLYHYSPSARFRRPVPPILPRIPMFGCELDDRRLPFTWWGKPRVYGGYCAMMSLLAGEQLQLCRSAGGNPSNRSLRSKGRHSDGNATAPPDSAAVAVVFLSCYVFATQTLLCGCAGLSYPSHSTSQLPQSHGSELHDANETRLCSFTLARLAYWYEPAVCAKISIKTCAFGR
jgi:hypothetical protein